MVSPLSECYVGLTPEEMETLDSMRVAKLKLDEQAKRVLDRFRKPNQRIICVKALRKLCERAGVALDDERDNKSQYAPVRQFQALLKYAHHTDTLDPRNDEAFCLAVEQTYRAFAYRPQRGLQQLVPLPIDRTIEAALKGTKSSGLPFMVRKSESFSSDLRSARRILKGKRKPYPCFAYARIQHGVAGPKQRLVWGFPQSTTIIEASLARPLIDLFLRIKTPMVIGLRKFELAALMGGLKHRKWQYGLDFSAFDSSVSPFLIGIAFNILKTWFVDSEEVRQRFRQCEDIFVYTGILMPDGYMYAKKRGIPSGSYFTQLVGSIVNYLCLQYGVIKLTGKAIGRADVMVLGDDSIFGLERKLELGKLKAILGKAGLTLNEQKSHVAKRGQPLHFLGHTWVHGVIDRPLVEVAKRLVYPERSDESTDDPVVKIQKRILQYYADSRVMHRLLAKAGYFRGPDSNSWFKAVDDDLVETGWRKYLSSVMENHHAMTDFPTLGILY